MENTKEESSTPQAYFDTQQQETFEVLDNQDKQSLNILAPKIFHLGSCISLFALSLLLSIIVLPLALVYSSNFRSNTISSIQCSSCSYTLTETIPDQLQVPFSFADTATQWINIIDNAKESLRIVAFYWDLSNDIIPYGDKGRSVLDAIKRASIDRKIKVTVIQQKSSHQFPNYDSEKLKEWGAEIIEIDWGRAFGGVLHTKMIVADDDSFYLGSANMDWKSLNQVKEMGITVTKCPCITNDILLIFEKYYQLGTSLNSTFIDFSGWSQKTITPFNSGHPFSISMTNIEKGDSENGQIFVSAAPQLIATPDRTNDIDALVSVINQAEHYVYISVMDYLPFSIYNGPHTYWGEIDNAIKNAIVRNVSVNMLIANWNQTLPIQRNALLSLKTFGENFCKRTEFRHEFWCTSNLNVRIYRVPESQGYGPFSFTRVNHAKFMLSDRVVFISTSNWSKDYFYTTGGISLIGSHEALKQDLKNAFERDWDSPYASELE